MTTLETLRAKRAQMLKEIDALDVCIGLFLTGDKSAEPAKIPVEQRVEKILLEAVKPEPTTEAKTEATRRREVLLQCAADIGHVFAVKELREAFFAKEGSSDKNAAFVQNSITGLCGSGKLKRWQGKTGSYGLSEWFDHSGKLKPEYEKPA